MASIKSEKGTEFFSRYDKNFPHFLLEKDLLPSLSSEDVVQISGGPGSGKTELLYHFVLQCILPDSSWNGLDLGGLNTNVILLDNDCRFNLFRLIQVLEKRLKPLVSNSEEVSSFIDTCLEMLNIVKCTDYDTFVSTLRYLELLRSKKYILMIDGVVSFYWSNKMRSLYSQAKLIDFQLVVTSVVKAISKNGIPVILTKRKLSSTSAYDCSKLDTLWRKASRWVLELDCGRTAEGTTHITVQNVTENRRVLCTISNSGLAFHPHL